MEHYSAIKREDVLTHATTRMNHETIMLSEKASHYRSHHVWFHLCEISRIESHMVSEQMGGCQMMEGGGHG